MICRQPNSLSYADHSILVRPEPPSPEADGVRWGSTTAFICHHPRLRLLYVGARLTRELACARRLLPATLRGCRRYRGQLWPLICLA